MMSLAIPFFVTEASGSNADPVVPILLALVLLTVAAGFGGRLMTMVTQPPVLGELMVGLLIGNLAYWFGNPGITLLREGDALRRIADLALHKLEGIVTLQDVLDSYGVSSRGAPNDQGI